MKRIIFWTILVLACGGLAWHFVPNWLRGDEARVRAVVNGLISSLQQDNLYLSLLGIQSRLSDNYEHKGEDIPMRLDKQQALLYVGTLKQRLNYVDFRVDLWEPMKITLTGNTARVELTGRITAAKEGSATERVELMTERGMNRAVLTLAKEDGSWKVVASERMKHQPNQ